MNLVATNARALCHTVILIGVLTGLLFSCGEGIQLLPFPVTDPVFNGGLMVANAARSTHQRNILHSEKKPQRDQFKPKRSPGEQAGSSFHLSLRPHPQSLPTTDGQGLLTDDAFTSRPTGSEVLGRAPPLS